MTNRFDINKWLYGGAAGGYKEIIDLILSHGNVGDPLLSFRYACKGGFPHIALYLVSKSIWGYECPLEIACELNAVDIINELIRAGARDFHRGLMFACHSNSKDTMRLMVAHGAKICGSCGLSAYAHV